MFSRMFSGDGSKNNSLRNIQLTVDFWTFNGSLFNEYRFVLLQVDLKDKHKKIKLEDVINWWELFYELDFMSLPTYLLNKGKVF